MTRAVSDMVQGFRHSLQEVESATHQLYQESNQIRQVATQTEGSARQQESMTVQVAAAVSELAASSTRVREHARKSAELSALTNQDAATPVASPSTPSTTWARCRRRSSGSTG